jgi:alkylation response protein AidB-like acyl-CoA dehydrogenase
MDFELSDDQQALQEAARDLLDDLAAPPRVRAALDVPDGYDTALWRAIVGQGWLGVELPEDRGGLGAGMVELAVLFEEVGRHVAPVPFLPTALALGALARAVAEGAEGVEAAEVVDRWIEPLATGDAIGCVSWTPPSRAPSAREDGAAWVLSGRPDPVVHAPVADVAIVATADGLFAVDLVAVGRPAAEPAMDKTRRLGWLAFDGTPALRLGGADAVAAFLDRGAVAHAVEMLGAAARVLEMATEHAKDRVQFGKPIGSFQAVKHRCADMLVDVEGMRSSAYYAAWCIGAGHPDASVAASVAKTWCSDAARRVMASGLQVHGGIGFTWEHDLHLFLKRSQLDQVSFGDAPFHRQRLTDLLRPRVEAGESVL